jgi:hypothetical protein
VPVTIVLSSVGSLAAAVAAARSVDLASYTLHGGQVRDALLAAARSGADVRVRLEREPLDDPAGTLRSANDASVALLKAAGADAALTPPDAPLLHLKAAVVDGVAWLDDRNWSGNTGETVVRDSDPVDVADLASALEGGSTFVGGSLKLTKGAAVTAEVGVVCAAGAAPLALETESFGGGEISAALLERARAGLPTRVLVAGREARADGKAGDAERRLLGRLASLGIAVRVGNPRAESDEKLTVTADAAWIGSANATFAGRDAGIQADWGIATRDPGLVDGLRAVFELNWSKATEGKVLFSIGASEATEGR